MTTEAISVTATVPASAYAVFAVLADPASRELDPPRAISWEPGQEDAEGRLNFGGWSWRYDLAPVPDGGTEVRLTYDWSGATAQAPEVIEFPPFGVEHVENSLRHLAVLAAA